MDTDPFSVPQKHTEMTSPVMSGKNSYAEESPEGSLLNRSATPFGIENSDICCNKVCELKEKKKKKNKHQKLYELPCDESHWICKLCYDKGYSRCQVCEVDWNKRRKSKLKRVVSDDVNPESWKGPLAVWKTVKGFISSKRRTNKVQELGHPNADDSQSQTGLIKDKVHRTRRIEPEGMPCKKTRGTSISSKWAERSAQTISSNSNLNYMVVQYDTDETELGIENDVNVMDYKHSSERKSPTLETILTPRAQLIHKQMKKPKGIMNVGMTCYVNSILQVFGQTPGLTESLSVTLSNGKSKVNDKFYSITNMLYSILISINEVGSDSNQSVCTRPMLECLYKYDSSFSLGKQNDSHSFMLLLFDRIGNETGSKTFELFEGYIQSRFTYSECQHSDFSGKQLFTSLLIPISNSQNETLEAGLKTLFADEELNLCLECKTCKTVSKTTKTLQLTELPKNLVLQLGTFEEVICSNGKKMLAKKNTNVKFEETLRLPKEDKTIYQLYGVVSHSGTLKGGHYIAFVRRGMQWYHCSDNSVTLSDSPARKNVGAYLLFYTQTPKNT